MKISGKELIGILLKLNFKIIRVKGSHHFLKRDKLYTTIPVHNNRDLGIGLLLEILDNLEIKREKFRKYMKTKKIEDLK